MLIVSKSHLRKTVVVAKVTQRTTIHWQWRNVIVRQDGENHLTPVKQRSSPPREISRRQTTPLLRAYQGLVIFVIVNSPAYLSFCQYGGTQNSDPKCVKRIWEVSGIAQAQGPLPVSSTNLTYGHHRNETNFPKQLRREHSFLARSTRNIWSAPSVIRLKAWAKLRISFAWKQNFSKLHRQPTWKRIVAHDTLQR